jgi:NitT/TauT family transport system ATP-binding protein
MCEGPLVMGSAREVGERARDERLSQTEVTTYSGPILEVRDLSKVYGAGATSHHALASVGFDMREGEFVSVVGPSGSGKTTLLLILSGLLEPSGGSVRFKGREVREPPEDFSLVFQDYGRSLFPWMTARANVALPLKDKHLGRAQVGGITQQSLEAVGLEEAADRYPWQLSGGMQQRVAIARALALSPKLLLMDEPFASVDAQTRVELEDLLLGVWEQFRMTIVFVTHDIDEAVYLSDRVVVLSKPPARVLEEVSVSLPRPRNQIATKREPAYLEARTEILTLVMPQMKEVAES